MTDTNAALFNSVRPSLMGYCPLPWRTMENPQSPDYPIVLDGMGAYVSTLTVDAGKELIERFKEGRGEDISDDMLNDLLWLLMREVSHNKGDSVFTETWNLSDGVVRSPKGMVLATGLGEGLFTEFLRRTTEAGIVYVNAQKKRDADLLTQAKYELGRMQEHRVANPYGFIVWVSEHSDYVAEVYRICGKSPEELAELMEFVQRELPSAQEHVRSQEEQIRRVDREIRGALAAYDTSSNEGDDLFALREEKGTAG